MNEENWKNILQGKQMDFIKSYGNVALASDSNGNVYWVGPTGTVARQAVYGSSGYMRRGQNPEDSYAANDLANTAASLAPWVNQNFIKNSSGVWEEGVIAPNGTLYPKSEYTNQGATYDSTGKPSQNTPTSGPGTASNPAPATIQPSSPTTMATTPSTTQGGLPAGYKVTGQEPSGWATGPDGHMIKISDIPSGSAPAPTPTNTPTTRTGSTITGDPSAQRAALQAAGIDANLLSDSQVAALYLMQSYTESQAQKDKQIAPASLSQADMDKFLSDAKAEYAPYYQGQFDIAKNNLLQAVGQISGDNTYLEQQNAVNFQVQNEQAAQQAAAAGLARSGIRQLAEQRLKQQQTGLVESGRRKAQSDIYQLGSAFEQTFGQQGLNQAGMPSIQSAGNAALGIAPTTIGYNPIGVQGGGTQGAAQTTAERQEQARLARLEASKRLNNAYGSTATNLP